MFRLKYWKKLIIFLAGLPLILWVNPAAAATLSNGEARVSYQEGEVLLKNAETEDWVEVNQHLPIKAEDSLWVSGGGRAEIKFAEGSIVRLMEGTALEVSKLERTEDGARTELTLTEGTATFVAKAPYKGGLEFLVDTPTVTIHAPEEATFRLDVDSQGDASLVVHKGTVEANSGEGTVNLGPGQAVRFFRGKMSYQEYYAKDSWDQWNDRRDATYASAKSRKYLPPAMTSEAADLDKNGYWVSTEEYGKVWVPRAQQEDWAPYSNGHWVYVGSDMVWMPYESWGWAPFHYGRWVSLPVGWAWVPPLSAPFWVPAAVAWVTFADFVGWVPLAPFEPFFYWRVFGPGCYLFSDPYFGIFVTNVFVFKNCHFHGGIIGVHRHHFFDHHFHRAPISTADLKKAKAGDPKITPTKASFNPRPDKAVSPKALPSKGVMQKAKTARNKGLERMGEKQRREAFTFSKGRGKSSGKGLAPAREGTKPGVKSKVESNTPSKPAPENRGALSRTDKPRKDLNREPVNKASERRPSGVQSQRKPRSQDRTSSASRQPRQRDHQSAWQPRGPSRSLGPAPSHTPRYQGGKSWGQSNPSMFGQRFSSSHNTPGHSASKGGSYGSQKGF